jgi:hypothetical protein
VFTDWEMLGNGPDDTVAPGFEGAGDCVWAGGDHETMLAVAGAGGKVAFTGANAIADYSACTGYVIGDDSTDKGTDPRAAMLYRRDTGLVDAQGNRHGIGAFVRLNHESYDEIMQACWIFEWVGLGIQFPNTAMDQFNNGQPWDVVPGAQIEGGHYIVLTGRTSEDDNGVLTWARRQGATRRFLETYVDEAWAMVTQEELAAGKNRRGFDLAGLTAALANLG